MSSDVPTAPKSVRPTADAEDLAKTPVTLGVVLLLLAGVVVVASFFLYRDYAQGEQLTVIREAIAAHRQETVALGNKVAAADQYARERAKELQDAQAATNARLDRVLELLRGQGKP